MKDSGIDIVADIPYNWEMCCLRHLCTIETGNQDTQNADPTGAFPFYVRSPIIERSNTYTFDGEGILIAGDGAGAGRIFHYAFGKYAVHQRVYRLANFNKINSRFLFIYLSCLFEKEVEKGSAQSTVPSIRLPMLKSFIICIPSLIEQQKIVDYLDNKCSKIDEITAKIKTTINEYKNLKQSIITEAVTKGIRPDREMKDSGIEWIGKIPREWNIVKMKYLGKCRNGLTYSPDNIVTENGTLVLRSSNIKNGQLDFTDNVFVNCKIKPEFMVKNGDILICSRNGSRNLIGKNAIISKNLNASFGAFMMIFRCESSKYVQMILSSSLFSYYLGTFLTSTINQLTAENFNNMKIVYCDDIKEQQEIVNYLNKKCTKIDAVIAKKEQLVTELESYKKSLIYEIVTGKKEV